MFNWKVYEFLQLTKELTAMAVARHPATESRGLKFKKHSTQSA